MPSGQLGQQASEMLGGIVLTRGGGFERILDAAHLPDVTTRPEGWICSTVDGAFGWQRQGGAWSALENWALLYPYIAELYAIAQEYPEIFPGGGVLVVPGAAPGGAGSIHNVVDIVAPSGRSLVARAANRVFTDPGAGGNAALAGADASGPGDFAGGDVVLAPGAGAGTGAAGRVVLAGTPLTAVQCARLTRVPTLEPVYDVDFAALPAQDLLAGGAGEKTIDGRTWTLANATALQAAAINDGVHAGLYLRASTANTDNTSANLTSGALYVPFSQLSALAGNFAEWQEAWLWWCFSTPHVPNQNYEHVQLGLMSNGAYAAASLSRFHMQDGYGAGALTYARAVATIAGVQTLGVASGTAKDVFALRLIGGLVEMYSGSALAGNFPSRSALTLSGRASIAGGAGVLARDGWRAWVSVMTVNTAGNTDLLLRRMRLEVRS